MSRASTLITKVNNALGKIDASDRSVYKRLIVRSGGDPLTGRNMVLDTQDVLLSPQPAVRSAAAEDMFLLTANGVAPDGALICTVSASAVSRAELRDGDMTIVMKDSTQNDEEFFIAGFGFTVFGGLDITFSLVLRSKAR